MSILNLDKVDEELSRVLVLDDSNALLPVLPLSSRTTIYTNSSMHGGDSTVYSAQASGRDCHAANLPETVKRGDGLQL
jgi:hypothetical protein